MITPATNAVDTSRARAQAIAADLVEDGRPDAAALILSLLDEREARDKAQWSPAEYKLAAHALDAMADNWPNSGHGQRCRALARKLIDADAKLAKDPA